MKALSSVPLKNNNWKKWFADKTQLIDFFQKMKMDQNFLLIDFYSWGELSGLLMADRKLVPKIPQSCMQLQSVVWRCHLSRIYTGDFFATQFEDFFCVKISLAE